MPFYEFEDKDTGKTHKEFLKISELDQYLIDNPNIKQSICSPSQGDSVRLGIRRTDDGFQDALKEVKKNHWGNNISTRN